MKLKFNLKQLHSSETFYLSAVGINIILSTYVIAFILNANIIPDALMAHGRQTDWAKAYAAFFGGIQYTWGCLIGVLVLLGFFGAFLNKKCCK